MSAWDPYRKMMGFVGSGYTIQTQEGRQKAGDIPKLKTIYNRHNSGTPWHNGLE
jgi:hypothetical protein